VPSDTAVPEEKAEPPRDAEEQGDSKGTSEKKAEVSGGPNRARNTKPGGDVSDRPATDSPASRNAPSEGAATTEKGEKEKRSLEKAPAEGAEDDNPGEDKPMPKSVDRGGMNDAAPPAPSRAADVESNVAPSLPLPGEVAPRSKPRDPATMDPPPTEDAAPDARQDDAGASRFAQPEPPAGFARRVPPVADTASDTPNAVAPGAATLAEERPTRGGSPGASADENAALRSTSTSASASPRVRVIFLLRQAARAPSALELAAPTEAAPATPAPNAPAPAVEAPPVEAAPAAPSPQ
jgi:CDGSH-type Zn-finger protein